MSSVVREPLPVLRSAEYIEEAFFEIGNLGVPIAKIPIDVMSELLGRDSVLLGLDLPGHDSVPDLDTAASRSQWLRGRGMESFSFTTKLWSPIKWHVDLLAVLHLQGRIYAGDKRRVDAALVGGIEEGDFEDWKRDFCVDPPIDLIIEEPSSTSEQVTDSGLVRVIYTGEVKTGEGLIIGGQGYNSFHDEAVAAAHCFGGAGEWAVLYSSVE